MGVAGSNRRSDRAAPKPAASRRMSDGRASRRTKSRATLLKFTIPSALAATREVHKSIMDAVEQHRYDEQSLFAIRLALEEGLMNAVKHGNALDPKKKVKIAAKVTEKCTEIVIEDQGKGFNRRDVPDPCCGDNLLKCSGRGILLMEAYMDEVEYSNGGRKVRMMKKNERLGD